MVGGRGGALWEEGCTGGGGAGGVLGGLGWDALLRLEDC